MGLAIALEDERGERIETVIDPTNLLHRLLLHYQGQESLLGQIGTATRCSIAFKCLFFSLRGEHLLANAQSSAELALLEQVMLLAKRCEDDVHLYIKFIGD